MIKHTYKKKGINVTEIKDAEYIAQRDTMAEATAEARAWAKVRNIRNDLLAATDKYMTVDNPKNTPELQAYRAALRDLPEAFESPQDVVWPTNPLEVE